MERWASERAATTSWPLALMAVCGVYVGLAWLSHVLLAPGSGIAVFWPPNGFLAALMLRGERRRPWILAAVVPGILVDLAYHTPALVALAWVGVNAIEAFGVAEVARRLARGRLTFTRRADVAALLVAAIGVPMVCAVPAAAALSAGVHAPFGAAWRSWWLGDLVAYAVVIPVVVTLGRPHRHSWIALCNALVVLGATAVWVFGFSTSTYSFLVVAALVVLASWDGERGAAAGGFVLAAVTAIATAQRGPHGWDMHGGDATPLIQLFLTVASMTALLLSASQGERRRAVDALAETDGRFRLLAEHATDLIMCWRPDGQLVYVSPSATRLLGVDATTLVGGRIRGLAHPDDLAVRELDERSLDGLSDVGTADLRLRHGDGSWREFEFNRRLLRDRAGRVIEVQAHGRDVTERKDAEDRLWQMATHDALTGLPNRSLLFERLAESIHHRPAVLFIDLDGFKDVNDGMGHDAGDELLRVVARRLRASFRAVDFVARFGGDEFVVVTGMPTDPAHALALANRVEASLSEPYVLARGVAAIGASVGVIMASEGITADRLLVEADAAMYARKRARREGGKQRAAS